VADEIRFDWDQGNIEHIARHDVTQQEAEQALENDPMEMGYEIVDDEERWISVGHTNKLRILKVSWTIRKGTLVRVVTAFEVSRNEAREYLRTKVGQ